MYTLTALVLTWSVRSPRLWLSCLSQSRDLFRQASDLEPSAGGEDDPNQVSLSITPLSPNPCSCSVFICFDIMVLVFLCVFWFLYAATGCSHDGVLCGDAGAGRSGWDVLQQLFPLHAVGAGPGPVECPQPVGAEREAGAGARRRPSGALISWPSPRNNPSAPAWLTCSSITATDCFITMHEQIITSKKKGKGDLECRRAEIQSARLTDGKQGEGHLYCFSFLSPRVSCLFSSRWFSATSKALYTVL